MDAGPRYCRFFEGLARYGRTCALLKVVFPIVFILFGIYNASPQDTGSGTYETALENKIPDGSFRELGLDSTALYQKVDSLMALGIREGAFPGAQLLVAYQGKTVYHKVFGYHTYDSLQAVGRGDLYDLASVTKIAAALPALMKLVESGIIDLDAPFSTYWTPWKRRRDKRDLSLREILAHQAGLRPYIVFLQDVQKKRGKGSRERPKRFKKRFIRDHPGARFQKPAYQDLYVRNRFVRKMYRKINRSEVSDAREYLYSGLSFLLFPALVEQLSGQPFEAFLSANIYGPIGIRQLVFLPSSRLPQARVVPTEYDSLYRGALVRGWVHDENASLMGGISGNAGLFGTAGDLATLMQCYADYGRFGGRQILDSAVVAEFARVQYPENENRRGLGFDKPLLGNDTLSLQEAYPAPLTSPESFGHSGFTGTFVWADPKKSLVFVFLSNRVYPSRSRRRLYELHLRTALQQCFYEALTERVPEGQ